MHIQHKSHHPRISIVSTKLTSEFEIHVKLHKPVRLKSYLFIAENDLFIQKIIFLLCLQIMTQINTHINTLIIYKHYASKMIYRYIITMMLEVLIFFFLFCIFARLKVNIKLTSGFFIIEDI